MYIYIHNLFIYKYIYLYVRLCARSPQVYFKCSEQFPGYMTKKPPSFRPPLTSSTKGAAKETNTILKCFLLANIFLFLVGYAYSIDITICKWVIHY